jgi:periplasmic divalent cation tolerance protein
MIIARYLNLMILFHNMILIYITCKDKEEAKKISEHLLKKRLVACTNIYPIDSMYWWKGKIQEDYEIAIMAKTGEKNYEQVKEEVLKIHSYETPCVIRIKAEANKEYNQWIEQETS